MKLKDTTEENLIIFLNNLDIAGIKDQYPEEQAQLIGGLVTGSEPLFDTIDSVMTDPYISPMEKVASLFVVAFQMGRQFELFNVMNSMRKGNNEGKTENAWR